jgi:hypothetical protein
MDIVMMITEPQLLLKFHKTFSGEESLRSIDVFQAILFGKFAFNILKGVSGEVGSDDLGEL